VTDNGQPIRKAKKQTTVSAANEAGSRTGYIYLENLQAGEHVVQVTGQ
jgi:hypothetical protein